MKFELEPYRRNVPDETFLEELRRVAQKLGKSSVTMEEYAEHGTFHPSSIARRFGSWFVALQRAGLSKSRSNINIPLETCVADLKRVAQQLGKITITQEEYADISAHGRQPWKRTACSDPGITESRKKSTLKTLNSFGEPSVVNPVMERFGSHSQDYLQGHMNRSLGRGERLWKHLSHL